MAATASPATMSPTHDTVPETRLCDDCEALRFNDGGDCGGFMDKPNWGGPPMLNFKFEDEEFISSMYKRKRLMHQNRADSSPDFPALAKSAAAGCGLCAFLRAAILRANVEALETHKEASIHLFYSWGHRRYGEPAEGLVALTAKLHDDRDQEVGTLQFRVYARNCYIDATRHWLGLESPPQRESLCPDNIKFLNEALEMCTSNCHPPTKTSFLPTRLLDLGADPASHTPRLIISADSLGPGAQVPAEPIRYAALSYAWGSSANAAAQTKTEPSNLHQRLRAIPTQHMSAVMQDAVIVCRALSVRYLWIDALCIIQDPADPSDWERESERVGQVFQHAYFTICALSTSNCHQSFLARSQYTFDLDFQSSLYPPAWGTYTLVCTGLHSGLEIFGPVAIEQVCSTWAARGWVFQEKNLSTRKLYFGQHMVNFACGALEVLENGEVSQPGIVDWSAAAIAELSRKELYRQFMESTSCAAGRGFSHESDRLPALSGVAKLVYDATGGKYLAGLWKEDLYRGLLWYRARRMGWSLVERLAVLRASTGSSAPSWSWVSQPGYFADGLFGFRLPFRCSNVRPEYSDIDGWTVLSGAQRNPFGEVRSGTIRVQGKVSFVLADFILVPQSIFPNHDVWKVYRQGVVVVYCHLDWAVSLPRQNPANLEMLLLSSSCSAEAVPTYLVQDDNKGESKEQDQKDNIDGYEDGDELELEGDLGQGSPSETEIHGSGKIPADGGPLPGSTCDPLHPCRGLCDNEKANRHAWGLIIHPAEKPGEYYRMGVFMSPASTAGGRRLFKDAKERIIDIV